MDNKIRGVKRKQKELSPTVIIEKQLAIETDQKKQKQQEQKQQKQKQQEQEQEQEQKQKQQKQQEQQEQKQQEQQEQKQQEDEDDGGPLSHLHPYIDEPYAILDSYFKPDDLKQMVRHQVESMNHFIKYQMLATIHMFNTRTVMSDKDYNIDTGDSNLSIKYQITNVQFYSPQLFENNGAARIMFPTDARLRNFTYASKTTVDIHIQVTHRYESDDLKTDTYVIPAVKFIDMPIMVHSSNCIVHQYKQQARYVVGECPRDCGGYFIIKGQEKVVLGQERPAENRIYVFAMKTTPKWSWHAEFRSIPDTKCISPKQVEMFISSKPNLYGYSIYVTIPRLKQKTYIELFVLFRAMGVCSDKSICDYILLNAESHQQAVLLSYLEASMYDAAKYIKSQSTIQEDALKHVMSLIAYNTYPTKKYTKNTTAVTVPLTWTDKYTDGVVRVINIYEKKFVVSKQICFSNYFLHILRNRRSITKQGKHKKREYTIGLLNDDLFPHCTTTKQKLYMLGRMTNQLIRVALKWDEPCDRDSYTNKRVDITGPLINNLFRNLYNRFVKEFDKNIIKEIDQGSWTNPMSIVNATNIHKMFYPNTIETGINRALSTGDFSVKQSSNNISTAKVGVAQVMSRLNFPATLSHLRRINTPLEKTGELIAPRKLHPTTVGFLCPVETPEGQSVGLVKQLALLTQISISTNSSSLYEYICPFLISIDRVDSPRELYGKVKVIINGAWIGVPLGCPLDLYYRIKQMKYQGIINNYTSVIFDYVAAEIRVCNDGGRILRPLLRICPNTNKALITKKMIGDLSDASSTLCWNELTIGPQSVIEYVDIEEQTYSYVALNVNNSGAFVNEVKMQYANSLHTRALTNINNVHHYTHAEIHPSTFLGVLASCVPFPHLNQSPRNTYQCAMAKQAMGLSYLNWLGRMDKTSYVLNYGSKPLVDTRAMDCLKLNILPSGCQVIVAIMSYTGYNQEDSILLNRGSVDRGMFLSTIYQTEKDEDKNISRDEIIRCSPDPSKTKGMKMGNYGKINIHGNIPENELVENRDILFAKIVPIKENRNDPTKKIKFEDQSRIHRTSEETYVDMNYTGRNGDGYNFMKSRLRILRKPTIGDKFASRSAQKGTAGNIVDEKDMPFMANGLRPDILLNPHAIPSRMTVAQLAESPFGKVLIELGMFGDGSCFGNIDIKTIMDELSRCGMESHGNEILYDGHTGKQLEASIFMGPVFYQRLKHMVNDKEHSRAIGPMVNLTRQPLEGRSKDGGFRVGEMERDVFLSHGIAAFSVDRFYHASDAAQFHVCKKCGMMAAYNDGNFNKSRSVQNFTVHYCNTCKNSTDFAQINIPYSLKLLSQELQAMNIGTRFITK